MANYLRTAIPATVPNRLEALLVFFLLCWQRLHGQTPVVEVAGGQAVPAFQSGGTFVGADDFTYVTFRIRLRIDPTWATNGLTFWSSALHTGAEVVAIPTVFGGV